MSSLAISGSKSLSKMPVLFERYIGFVLTSIAQQSLLEVKERKDFDTLR
jgi:hypothetical protein